jgi:hypothetical protein
VEREMAANLGLERGKKMGDVVLMFLVIGRMKEEGWRRVVKRNKKAL